MGQIPKDPTVIDPCETRAHNRRKWISCMVLFMVSTLNSSLLGACTQTELTWNKDVSHARIPNRPAAGRMGDKLFTVTKAQLRESVNPGKSHKDVTYNTLELTAKDGTPGAEFILGVPAGAKLDGKTLWYQDMFNHSPSIFGSDGKRRVEYVPIQSIWLHGARKPEFKLLPVFEMLGVMHYSIRVEFGTRSKGKIPGQIYFCGEADSFMKTPESIIVGTFVASTRPPSK